MALQPLPPGNGLIPTGVTGGPPLSPNEVSLLAISGVATSPTLTGLAHDYFDIYHLGVDYMALGNATAANQDPAPFWNQVFSDYGKAWSDFQVTAPANLSDWLTVAGVPAGGGGTPISQIAYGTGLMNFASSELGKYVFGSPTPVTA